MHLFDVVVENLHNHNFVPIQIDDSTIEYWYE
jgi:hypothetical protein